MMSPISLVEDTPISSLLILPEACGTNSPINPPGDQGSSEVFHHHRTHNNGSNGIGTIHASVLRDRVMNRFKYRDSIRVSISVAAKSKTATNFCGQIRENISKKIRY